MAKGKKKSTKKKVASFYKQGVPSGIQRVQVANLRFSTTKAFTVSNGAMVTGVIVANGASNPEGSGLIVSQPMGWDQWASLYNHYVVLGSKITVTFCPSTIATPVVCGVYLTDAPASPYSSYSQFIEARKGTQKMMTPYAGPVSVISKFSAKQFFNVVDVKDNLDRLGNTISLNPLEEASYVIWAQTVDKASSSPTIYATVTVDYTVSFSEPKDLPSS
jgi:hypothetical protein